jgi:hypothetical protein
MMGTRLLGSTRATALAALALLVCGVNHAGAVPVLDQSFEPPILDLILGIAEDDTGAQTFTVGIAGVLTQVDVLVERNGFADVHFDLRPTIGGVPIEDGAMALASVTLPASAVPFPAAFLSFDVSSFGISVVQGDVLAIALGGNSRWSATRDDLYPGGAAFFRSSPDLPTFGSPSGIRDLGFRTFVEPAAVALPEPGTFTLLLAGLLGLSAFARRDSSARSI